MLEERGTNWHQHAYLKAPNAEMDDSFAHAVAISGDTIVVGANGEDSNATGINGNQLDNSAQSSGAAYVFTGFGSRPCLTIARDTGTGFMIRSEAPAGSACRLQRAANATGPWDTRATMTVPPSGLLEYHDTTPLSGHAFYRAVQP